MSKAEIFSNFSIYVERSIDRSFVCVVCLCVTRLRQLKKNKSLKFDPERRSEREREKENARNPDPQMKIFPHRITIKYINPLMHFLVV